MTRNIKAEEAHPIESAKITKGMGTHVLTVQPQKTAPIIDADRQQEKAAAANLARVQANRRHIAPIVEA